MKYVGKSIQKVDSIALITGKPVYTDDLAPKNCLFVKLLRSPHAFAKVIEVDCERALKLPGVENIFTYKDVPKIRFSRAGQSHPVASPNDSLIIDEYVRYIGDAVAIVAAKDERTADEAIKLIKAEYEILEPLLDFEKASSSEIIIHPEEDFLQNIDFNSEVKRNIIGRIYEEHGDLQKTFGECDEVVEETYYIQAQAHSAMETHRAFSYYDEYGKLTTVCSTQTPFHVRRMISMALELPLNKVRVVKPRVGGGFGAKQTSSAEVYTSFVTFKTGKPSKMVYSRKEVFTCTNSKHQMRIRMKIGASKDGKIKAVEMEALSNTGAYGEHSCTTLGLVGGKTLPLYNKFIEAQKFDATVVYTNIPTAGAFRGYGATQGTFAVESTVNKLADKLNIDPTEIRKINLIEAGDISPFLSREHSLPPVALTSSSLLKCIERGKELIEWDKKYKNKNIVDNKIKSVGMAVCMQGSGISGIDTANVVIKLNEGGSYTLMHGASDIGTGSDTALSQIAAEILETPVENINVNGVDTDYSPFDPGSYASSTTLVTGSAAKLAAEDLRNKIIALAAAYFETDIENINFDGEYASFENKNISLEDLSYVALSSKYKAHLEGKGFYGLNISPPPFVAGFAEIEIDLETGKVTPVKFIGVVDCGTVVNENLARVQAEGGFSQGIGMALYEDVKYLKNGRLATDSFMQYSIPTRADVGEILVDFVPSYEPNGPFGAKSIGEVVNNTPSPAIQNAIYNATGLHLTRLPMSSEDILMGTL